MEDINEYIKKSKKERQQHIKLSESCIDRGGDSIQFRGLLAHYLNTTIPSKHIALCCHACNNSSCSNPKHLYWGTSKENYEDALHSGRVLLNPVKGVKHPNYEVPPWDNFNGKPDSWLLTGYIYKEYYLKNWSFSKYGQGPSYFQNKYNISQGCSKGMIKRFRKGWNPYSDPNWLEFCKNNFTILTEMCYNLNIDLQHYKYI